MYRPARSGVEIVLCGRGAPPIWALPKGTPEPGETREQTALREASEETGLELAINSSGAETVGMSLSIKDSSWLKTVVPRPMPMPTEMIDAIVKPFDRSSNRAAYCVS